MKKVLPLKEGGGPAGTRTLAPVCEANFQYAGNSSWSVSVAARVHVLNLTEAAPLLKIDS